MRDDKYAYISELLLDEVQKLTKNGHNWLKFLENTGTLYKYSFKDNLVINAHRENATMCADFDTWSKKLGYRIKQGTKGIPLLRDKDGRKSFWYVYDISDTVKTAQSRDVHLWTVKDSYKRAVAEGFKAHNELKSEKHTLESLINERVTGFLDENIERYVRELELYKQDSLLEDYDRDNLALTLREIAEESVEIAVCGRCGINRDIDEYALHKIGDFNTVDTISQLGELISTGAGTILREIEREVRYCEKHITKEENDYERENDQRNETHLQRGVTEVSARNNDGEQHRIPSGRGDNDLSSDAGTGRGGRLQSDELGPQEARLHQGEQAGLLSEADDKGSVGTSGEHRQAGLRDGKQADERNEQSRGDNRGAEESRPSAKYEKELFVKSKIDLLTEGDMLTIDGENYKFIQADYRKIEVYPDNPDSKLCYTIQGANENEPHYYIDNYRLEKTDFAIDTEKEEQQYKFFRTGNNNELKILYQPNVHDYISARVDNEVFHTAYTIADTGNTFDTPLFYRMLLAYADKETINDGTLFYMQADNEFKNGIPLFENFTAENVDLIGDFVENEAPNLGENVEVEAAHTAENDIKSAVAVGDRFKNKFTGEICEVKSLEGALPWQTDHLTVIRQSGNYEITENLNYGELLDASKYERVTDVEKAVDHIETAKQLISEYIADEFSTEDETAKPDFADLLSIPLGYTTADSPRGEEISVEPFADLINRNVYVFVGDVYAKETYFETSDELEVYLANMTFGELTDVDDTMWDKYYTVTEKEAAEMQTHSETQLETVKPHNFTLTEDMNTGTPKEQFRANIEAIQLLKQLESENKQAAPEQQTILAKYMGWGGLSDAFDSHKDSWSNEYNELQELLSPEEYSSARATVLNSHFTSPVIIQAMYKGLEQLGFDGGTILEPSMGVGNFFGAMPENIKENSKVYGVELDDLTGRIAKQLYPEANIQIKGFQKTAFNSNSFDVAVGNVPFGTNKIYDNELQCYDLIHDYFFKKALDKVHPGGIVAFVTSMGTMDKASEGVRKYLAERAELVGAVRLPDTAFKNANTSVTSDIIFLKKRDEVLDFEKSPENTPDWVQTKEDANGNIINSYFADHPEMIVGEMREESGPYGYRLVCKPVEGDFAEQLNEAISHLQGNFERDEHANSVEEEIDPAYTEVDFEGHRNFCYCEVDGKIYFRENEMMIPQELEGKKLDRVKGMIGISAVLQELIAMQRDGYSDDEIKVQQEILNGKYEAFTKKFGLISSDTNMNLFRDDDTSELISSLENIDENGELISKADIFTKRTIVPYVAPTHADTVSDALTISISEKARVDLDYMSKLCGKDKETILSEMEGVIFENPVSGKYETADEYLSGDVREKLRIAEVMAENNERFAVNVNALREVQPEDLKPAEISIQLCSTWIPVKYYEQFMYETFDTPYRCQSGNWYANVDPFSTSNSQTITIQFDERTATYGISNKGSSRADSSNIKVNKTYGTSRVNAYKILEDTLNNKTITVKDYIEEPDGRKRAVVNQKETLLAQEKQSELKEKFKEWIWDDPDRTEELCRIYNENFNSIRPREYDGSHINFVGMNPEIKLRPHQLNAIAHTLYGGNTLLAHTVGAGKTFEAVASAMEAKRLGLCRKSLICVPKHIVNQFGKEFMQLYPNANILVASEKDFQKKNRRRFFSRIATGNYDAVIISHSQLEKLPISPERRIDYVQNQIEEITVALDEMRRMEGKRRFTVKQLEITCQNLEDKLEKLINEEKYDTNIFFEDMGFDKMFIDEAHMFKNLQFITKMGRNVSGINASSVSQRATDLALKVKYMDEITGGRGTVFMTGTPEITPYL